MKINFGIIRDGLTATSVVMDMVEINQVRRWVASSLRLSGCDTNKYHFMAWADHGDISGTDRLEEMTGTITGTSYKIINKRDMGSFIEFDLEPIFEHCD